MDHDKAFSIRFFIPSGEPGRLRLVTKTNWCGLGFEMPRIFLGEAGPRPELKGTGVYLLYSAEDASGLPRIYIGEADNVYKRLLQHDAGKDFWDQAVAFVSKDQTLNKAHARWIEQQMLNQARQAARYKIANKQVNAGSQERPLSEEDRADATAFLQDLLLCLRAMGYDGFEGSHRVDVAPARSEPTGPTGLAPDMQQGDQGMPDGLLRVETKGASATGYFTSSGGFVVEEGSTAVGIPAPKWLTDRRPGVSLRETLIGELGVLKEMPDTDLLRFTRDYEFRSANMAVAVVCASSVSAPNYLKDDSGKSLKEIRQAVADQLSDDDDDEPDGDVDPDDEIDNVDGDVTDRDAP